MSARSDTGVGVPSSSARGSSSLAKGSATKPASTAALSEKERVRQMRRERREREKKMLSSVVVVDTVHGSALSFTPASFFSRHEPALRLRQGRLDAESEIVIPPLPRLREEDWVREPAVAAEVARRVLEDGEDDGDVPDAAIPVDVLLEKIAALRDELAALESKRDGE